MSGLAELSQQVSADPRFTRCLATKLYTFGLGRVVTDADQPLLDAVVDDWLAPGQPASLRRLLQVFVLSEAFRFRRGAP